MKESRLEQKRSKNRAKTGLCETSQPKEISTLLPNHSATHWNSLWKFSQLQSRVWHTSATSQHRSPHFGSCETAEKLQRVKISNFAAKAPFSRVFRSCETNFWHTSANLQHSSPHFEAAIQLRNHFLAHECHFAAPYTHFRAVKSLLSSEMAMK